MTSISVTATHRKPAIYLIVLLPVMVVGGLVLVIGLTALYSRLKNISLSDLPDLNGMLISLPAVFLWIPCALLFSNWIFRLVPPLRAVAEKYTAQTKRPDFGESQRSLLKILYFFALICLPLILLGFLV